MMKALLCLLFVGFAFAQLHPQWNAIWTDSRYGGPLYTCTDGGTKVFGTYSDIGFFEGSISSDGNTVTGDWVESGFTDLRHGDFTWTLSATRTSFTGLKTSDDRECAPIAWSETRTSSVASFANCFPLTNDTVTRNIEGQWSDNAGSLLNICLSPDDDEFWEASYSGPIGTGYTRGRHHEQRKVARGSYTETGDFGIHLFLTTNSTAASTMTEFFYQSLNSVSTANFATSIKGRRTWTRTNLVVNSTTILPLCRANRNLWTNPWVGTFTDNDFGSARLHTCVTGNAIHGIYSEVGWITGTISNNTATGRFYDAGNSDEVAGTFTLELAADKMSFLGKWNFDRNTARSFIWNDTRVSVATPSSIDCLTLTPAASTAAGKWRFDTGPLDNLDICFDATNSRFTASYNFDSGQGRGYLRGFVQENGKALQAEWFEPNKQGIEILRLTDINQLSSHKWPQPDIQTMANFLCDDDEANVEQLSHRFQVFNSRLSPTASQTDCARNSDLTRFEVSSPFTPNSNSPSGPPSPSGSSPNSPNSPNSPSSPNSPNPSSPNPSPNPSSPNPSPNPSPPNSSPNPSPNVNPSPGSSPSGPPPTPSPAPPFFPPPLSPQKPRAPPPTSSASSIYLSQGIILLFAIVLSLM